MQHRTGTSMSIRGIIRSRYTPYPYATKYEILSFILLCAKWCCTRVDREMKVTASSSLCGSHLRGLHFNVLGKLVIKKSQRTIWKGSACQGGTWVGMKCSLSMYRINPYVDTYQWHYVPRIIYDLIIYDLISTHSSSSIFGTSQIENSLTTWVSVSCTFRTLNICCPPNKI